MYLYVCVCMHSYWPIESHCRDSLDFCWRLDPRLSGRRRSRLARLACVGSCALSDKLDSVWRFRFIRLVILSGMTSYFEKALGIVAAQCVYILIYIDTCRVCIINRISHGVYVIGK